jgi:hypothetical protein
VGDRRFVSDRIMFTHRGFSQSATQRLVEEYPVDKAITVYFDPKNPGSAVRERGIPWFFCSNNRVHDNSDGANGLDYLR